MSLGLTEILLIVGVALLFFGPSRLPGMGKGLGEAIRGFKKGMEDPDKSAPREQIKGEAKSRDSAES